MRSTFWEASSYSCRRLGGLYQEKVRGTVAANCLVAKQTTKVVCGFPTNIGYISTSDSFLTDPDSNEKGRDIPNLKSALPVPLTRWIVGEQLASG